MIRHEVQLSVEFSDAARGSACIRAHLGNQKAAAFGGHEVVCNGRFHGLGGKQESRISVVADVEEEDAVLPLENAQQPAASQNLPGGVQVTVVGFVRDVAGRR